MDVVSIIHGLINLFNQYDINKLSLFLVFVCLTLVWFTIKDKRADIATISELDKSIQSLSGTIRRNRISEEFISDQEKEKCRDIKEMTEEIIDTVTKIQKDVESIKNERCRDE